MFTGIVEEVGTVRAVAPLGAGRSIEIEADIVLEGTREGDSIAVDGVCMTVTSLAKRAFRVEAIGTTLSRTTVGSFAVGRRVNLERALAFGDRLGGHLVQGHVDEVGRVVAVDRREEHVLLDLALPDAVAAVTVPRGSIAVNGVSMTVNAVPAPGVAQIAVIPHTWQHTTFPDLRPGDRVNLEGDMLGRFVVHYLDRVGTARGISDEA